MTRRLMYDGFMERPEPCSAPGHHHEADRTTPSGAVAAVAV